MNVRFYGDPEDADEWVQEERLRPSIYKGKPRCCKACAVSGGRSQLDRCSTFHSIRIATTTITTATTIRTPAVPHPSLAQGSGVAEDIVRESPPRPKFSGDETCYGRSFPYYSFPSGPHWVPISCYSSEAREARGPQRRIESPAGDSTGDSFCNGDIGDSFS